jgi:8-oxo-dGTP pyrophosphatase MutT (NUDIX family)
MICIDIEPRKEVLSKVSVLFIFYNHQTNKILIEERSPDQIFSGKKIFPGGSMEKYDNNNLVTAFKREVSEELGVTPTKYLNLEYPIIGETGAILCPFLITKWDGNIPNKVLDKGNSLEWVDLDSYESELESVRKIHIEVKRFVNSKLFNVAQS